MTSLHRTFLVAVLLWSLPCGAVLIDFEDLTDADVVTDQYQQQGVLFAGAGSADDPVVHDFGDFSLGKVLRGADWDAGLEFRFVEADAPGVFRPVRRFRFANAMDTEDDEISVQVYDASGALIHSLTSHSPENVVVELSSAVIARVVVDDVAGTSFVLDDLDFPGVVVPTVTSSWGGVKALFR